MRQQLKYVLLQASFLRESLLSDRSWQRVTEDIPLPPPKLRHRVHGAADAKSFLNIGRETAQTLKEALKLNQQDISTFENVLDFGCGCSRVLRWFKDYAGSTRFYGCDIDEEAIFYSKQALPFARFHVTKPLAPLPYADEKFDLVSGISVLTHLNEDTQFFYLKELHRITKPGGIVFLSTNGGYVQRRYLSSVELNELKRNGIFFKCSSRGPFKLDGLPEFYQDTFHTREYILDNWSKFFKILRISERGLNNYQDLVMLQKPEKPSSLSH
jgi:SAM-dependent methyltransferase